MFCLDLPYSSPPTINSIEISNFIIVIFRKTSTNFRSIRSIDDFQLQDIKPFSQPY